MIRSFQELLEKVKEMPSKRVVIPDATNSSSIGAAILGKKENIAEFLLIGDEETIKDLIKEKDPSMIDAFEIIDEPDSQLCVNKAVEAIHQGKADLILKGKTSTSQLMKGVLNKQTGLQTGNVLSDVFIFEARDRITLMTDGGIILYPEIKEKIAIINNAVKVAHSLDNPNPKVALLAAVEVVNPKMPPTIDASIIAGMSKRGQIKDCIVDGPFALDNAIDKEAARIKGVDSPVAGDADVLIVPSIEAGNIFGKALTYYANVPVAHVVMGAKVPILITSRADDSITKLNSIALGIICA